jgi:hypothetical protein
MLVREVWLDSILSLRAGFAVYLLACHKRDSEMFFHLIA